MSDTMLEPDHTIKEYKKALIAYLSSGHPTGEQWDNVATAVLHASEMCELDTRAIDRALYGECPVCREPRYAGYCEAHEAHYSPAPTVPEKGTA